MRNGGERKLSGSGARRRRPVQCSTQTGRTAREGATAPVWRALADPTRRHVLDLLVERPRTTGDIASRFDISRIAVMRHLEVLGDAGLVTSRKRGRERWHYLNAVPLERIYERWLDPQASGWASRLLRLERQVEARDAMPETPLAVDVALDISIAGSPAEVFSALTDDPGGWWGHPFVRPEAVGITLDPRLGGLLYEQWPEGGEVIGTVTSWADDRHLGLSGPFHLGVALGVASFDLSPTDDGTRVQFSFRAFGPVDPAQAAEYSKGWQELVGRRLKALVETRTRLGVAPDPPPTHIRTRGKRARSQDR